MADPPARLAVTVTHANGNVTRWGGDEADPHDVPASITFGTSMPGGFKDAGLSLPRRIDRDYPDLNLYDDIKVYQPGGQSVWEGRVAQLPLQHDTSFAVNVGAIGWSAHLTDDSSFQMIYVDRDLSGWGEMATQRRINWLNVGYQMADVAAKPDTATGFPALVTTLTGAWSALTLAEPWYDAGPGNLISAIYYDFVKGTNIGLPDANWNWQVCVASDDVATANLGTANLAAASGAAYYTPATAYRYAFLLYYYAVAGGGANAAYDVIWRKLAIYGNHGLTRRGTDPGGFYASDVIPDILSRAAPLLNYTTGDGGSIAATSFVIPHLVFRDPGTASDAIEQANGYHRWQWAVWENRTFYYQQPDPGRVVWQARLSDGAQVSLEGDDASNIYNGVVVQYTDPAGKSHTVSPPGGSVEATDSSLADTSSTNPINAHGIPRRWALLNISQTTTQAAAIQLGAIWLADHSTAQHRGTITLNGYAQHPTKGRRPVAEIRAGDSVTIADRPGDEPRPIIETSYTHDSRQIQLTCGNTAFKTESILERLGVSLIGVV